MFGLAAFLVIAAGAVAFFFGHLTSFGIALTRVLPGMMASSQSFIVRNGGTGLWYNVVLPVMETPCWVPFLALGALFLIIGILRRV
ncbi:hypothetical protein [Plastoroseomonas arctica]|uniref:Transmembrane protein n=1 Tax=Plastoroseomonas arctica TaxID=1509237 RepID=A0AAF1KHM2_9PROT|nr:hypothetical protein [Plastoroseomonas arctica]MBR0653595.1 hypothetical protein [Plastoroseomonas arctica]